MTSSPRLRVDQGAVLFAVALGVVAAMVATVIARTSGTITTYAGHSAIAAWCFASAGIGLFAAALITSPTRSGVARLAVLAGFLWSAPIWEGWEGGPSVVRTVGMLAASFVFPVLVHLVLAASGWPRSTTSVVLVGSGYVLIGLCTVVVLLVRDPYRDPYCWANCTTNVFDVSSDPDLARTMGHVQSWVTAILAAAFVVVATVRLTRALLVGPRRHWQVLPGGALLGAATVAYGALLRSRPLEDPGDAGYAALFLVRCAAVVLIAGGLAAIPLQARRQRRSVGEIIATLGDAPVAGTFDTALARAVGDPTLRILYWLPAAGHYVDADGRRRYDAAGDPSVTTTPLVRGGRTVALITHHSDPAGLERGLGSAARLALDNERLRAEARARRAELVESRKRIVEAGDARRRQLERDLHDGAQQSLLAMSYDLQRARVGTRHGDPAVTGLIDDAVVEVREAFQDVRDLAHGIYPAALAAVGLCPTITALIDAAPIPVFVDCALTERFPASTETAAYLAVAGIVDGAARSASRVAVTFAVTGDDERVLAIDIAHDATELRCDLVHITDRVGAVGGRLDADAGRISIELPCGS